jgi:DNA-directed RNA polymerase sigma subunit (sigma70/sigma32)
MTDVVAESEDSDRQATVAELLQSIPEIEHDAINSMIMCDTHVSSREWGERHGCSHEWARRVKNKALKRLREKLSEMYIDDKMAV